MHRLSMTLSSGLPGAADTGRAKASAPRQHGQSVGGHGQFGPQSQSQFDIVFTSFLEAEVRVGVARGERGLEGGQVAVEVGQLGLAASDSGTLRGDQRRKVTRHDVAPTGQALPGQASGGRDVQAKASQAHDQPQLAEILVGVLAIAVVASGNGPKDATALVEPDGSRGDPGSTRNF
jgi:hypothetical protein